jgi:hypothetical protein
MVSRAMRFTLFSGAVIALAGIASYPVLAAVPERATVDGSAEARPIVIAQATSRSVAPGPRAVAPSAAFPAYQRGVREAAAESNEALRRYIWRTRMIYDFYYPDFASGD